MQTYTKAQLAEILAKHKKWLANEEGGEQADLSNVKLCNVKLCHANLRYANLRSADLSWADLRNADLRNADLRNANLCYANFRNADLRNADLSELRSLCNTIGNNAEIKTVQAGHWIVTYTATQMQIGCKLYSIEQWWNFSDEEIAQMDKSALDWWQVWKPILKQIIAVSPAVASAAVAE